jgi:hypothetical protein
MNNGGHIPFVIYRIATLTIGAPFYSGVIVPLYTAGIGIVVLAPNSTLTARTLRRV